MDVDTTCDLIIAVLPALTAVIPVVTVAIKILKRTEEYWTREYLKHALKYAQNHEDKRQQQQSTQDIDDNTCISETADILADTQQISEDNSSDNNR